jgi:hypothetical protein
MRCTSAVSERAYRGYGQRYRHSSGYYDRVFLLERGFGMSYTITRLRKRKKRGENKELLLLLN